eukprot:3463585-Prymnesium_polylepis.1
MQASCRSGHVPLTLEVRLDGASTAFSGDKASATFIGDGQHAARCRSAARAPQRLSRRHQPCRRLSPPLRR